jgi:hypothetical protein
MGKIRRITFRADPADIDAAREQARLEGTTVNEQFRIWLQAFVDAGRAKNRTAHTEETPAVAKASAADLTQ